MSTRKTPEYRAIKNYIINTEKINREVIFDIVREHIGKCVEKELKGMLNSKWLQQQILNTIMAIVKEGFKDRRFYGDPEPLEDWIKEEIGRMLKRALLQKYEVVVKERGNDD